MIARDIHSLAPGSIVELFDLDITPIDPSAGVFRFHAGTNELMQPVVWQGNTYTPQPVQASGFGITVQGAAPRPTMQVSNIPVTGTVGLMTLLNRDYDDLVGAIVTRRRTLVKYLDAVNFPSGINATVDPSTEFPLDVYYVERRISENRIHSEYELSSIYDLEGVQLPVRQVIRDTCTYTYRYWDSGELKYVDPRGNPVECPYIGPRYFDRTGAAVTDPAQDVCGRRLSDCKLRFRSATIVRNIITSVDTGGNTQAQPMEISVVDSLPFGGFPGCGRYK
jgi:lambda family phage minor tail protein L